MRAPAGLLTHNSPIVCSSLPLLKTLVAIDPLARRHSGPNDATVRTLTLLCDEPWSTSRLILFRVLTADENLITHQFNN
jgi:hypothetical protein